MYERKDKVLKFIENRVKIVPLLFKLKDETLEKIGKLELDELILEVLKLTNDHRSYTDNVKISLETTSGRWRSVYDIWRHVLYFNKEVSLLDVMASMYKNKDKYSGHYCPDIHRRVFKYIQNRGSAVDDDNYSDEFNLKLRDWCEINE